MALDLPPRQNAIPGHQAGWQTYPPRGGAAQGGLTRVGAKRDTYRRLTEGAPSRFSNGGADYQAWAKRADEADL